MQDYPIKQLRAALQALARLQMQLCPNENQEIKLLGKSALIFESGLRKTLPYLEVMSSRGAILLSDYVAQEFSMQKNWIRVRKRKLEADFYQADFKVLREFENFTISRPQLSYVLYSIGKTYKWAEDRETLDEILWLGEAMGIRTSYEACKAIYQYRWTRNRRDIVALYQHVFDKKRA